MLIKSNQISCPKCTTSIVVINHNSEVFVCPSCYKIFTKDSKGLNIVFEADLEHRNLCVSLQIGEKIKYNNLDYILTGKLVKYEANDKNSRWAEYCFSCEGAKTIVLSESGGHWNISEQADELLKSLKGDINYGIDYQDKYLKLFHKYIIKLAYAEGEFDVNVLDDIGSTAIEYSSAPTTIIIEANKKGNKECFVSTYLFHGQVEKLVGRKIEKIERVGISGGQPFYFNFNFNSFLNGGILLIILFGLFTFLIGQLYPPIDLVKNKIITAGAIDSTKVIIFEDIDIPYDHCLMTVTLDCYNLDNDWIAADIDLINDSTNDKRFFSIETSKYSGYDDEGSWQSGGLTNDGNVENIEKGKYHLEVTPVNTGGSSTRLKVASLSIKVYKGNWSIFWLFSGIVVALQIIFAIVQNLFEQKKWEEEY